MTTTIEVSPGGIADAICEVVRAWAPFAETGQLRVTPNPINPSSYLIIVGDCIVAQLRILDQVPAC